MKSTRIAAIALASSLAGGLVATAAGAELFDDVNPEGQFAEHITSVQEAGIASGYGDGTFRPQNKISRQQAASWINRAASRTALDFADAAGRSTPRSRRLTPLRRWPTIEVTSPATASGGGWVTLAGLRGRGHRRHGRHRLPLRRGRQGPQQRRRRRGPQRHDRPRSGVG